MASINKYNTGTFWSFKWLGNHWAWPAMLSMLALLALIVGFLFANGMGLLAFAAVGALFAVLVVYKCLMDAPRGYYLLIFIAFFSEYLERLLHRNLPITTFVEVLVLVLFIGTYWHARKDDNQKGDLINYSISGLLIIYTLYYIIEIFNPNVDTPTGWLFSSKRFAVQLLFFVISYRLVNTPERVRFFLKFWIVMSFIAAAYGCYQQWFGLLPFEIRSIDAHEYGLLFQGGTLRKFSFFDGVVTFGSLCGCMAVVTIILGINEKLLKRKTQLFFISFILYLGMVYSGTRTFNLMIPAGLILYVIMTLRNRATLMIVLIMFLSLLFVLFAPIDSPSLNRIRSTFDTKDESLNTRTTNRRSIQPYIYEHPFGGGVATSGMEGVRFNPTHRLAGFPPDSQLLKLALDMGWIGLVITMAVFLMVLYQGIYYYFRIVKEEYRTYVVAATCSIFSIIVTLYSQVTIGQMPTIFFIFGIMSIFKRLMEFDKKERVEAE